MINDAHGSKFKNNCEFRMELKDKNGKYKCHERKICLYTLRKIKFGEELYASYGEEYWGSRL
jgi:SET domain-containing protein